MIKKLSCRNANFMVFIILLLLDFSYNASIEKYKKFSGDQGLYSRKDDVEILTNDNFKAAVVDSDRAWLVEFYNSWCGFCARFAPTYKEFATDVRGWNEVVVIAAVDCSSELNQQLCRNYEIMSYPSLRYYREGFHEAEHNYGDSIIKVDTVTGLRHNLVKKIIKEQLAGRGKHFPNLLPYVSSDITDLFTKAEEKFAVLIMQDEQALLGPEIVLDLHKTPNIVTYYGQWNNTDLTKRLDVDTKDLAPYPSVFLVARDKSVERVAPLTPDRQGFRDAIKDALKQKNIRVVLPEDSLGADDLVEKSVDKKPLLEKVEKMGDKVFQMDLETALRYSLKREVGGAKEISGEKLEALKRYVDILTKYFPFGRNGKTFLNDINNYITTSSTVEGAQIYKMVSNAEKDTALVFSSPKEWLGCRGSTTQYRGYPCGLWKMFHYLTVNVADYDPSIRGDNPRIALEAMHGYIKHFFGCADCSQHFQDMAARRQLGDVASFNESIIWLWEAHNEVNKRLSGDTSEDPDFPKIQFPSAANCPSCRKEDGSWNTSEVLKYLKHMYSSINIEYLGADTRAIYTGLDPITKEGLQEEAVQIQKRPVRKGVNGSGGTKDKASFMLPILTVLTVLYVTKFQ